MTKRECAVIMAHTGVCMLTGDDFRIFQEYIEKLMGMPIYTHELGNDSVAEAIREKSLPDFLDLCKNARDE